MGLNKMNTGSDLDNICFDTSLFVKDSFSIDDFLRNHRKATLEVLRNDLGTYLKVLRLSMIELINHDYEDFINLSKDLVGLNAGIEVLQSPLDQVRSEIIVVKQNVEETIQGIRQALIEINQVQLKKRTLHYLLQVLKLGKKLSIIPKQHSSKSFNLDFIERASSEFTNLLFSAEKCRRIMTSAQTEEVNSITNSFLNLLNNTFLECLCEKNPNDLTRCLKIYENMDKRTEVEILVRKEIVAPFLYDLVNETSLHKDGIKEIYRNILNFVDTQLDALTKAGKDSQWNFILKSLWEELAWRIEMHMSTIFAAGDAAIFHSRYMDTWNFLNALKNRSDSPSSAKEFDEHPKTIHFLNKWNLLVYYKIRFQEIAGQLESDMSELSCAECKDANYRLNLPFKAKLCLERCWNDRVYLPQLAHAFWQISLQIMSRYCVWTREQALKEMKNRETSETNIDKTRLKCDFLINLYLDTTTFACETKQILLNKVASFKLSEELTANVIASLEECEVQLAATKTFLSECIVQSLVKESVVFLSNVKDIPRLFRRTNREAPTKPCEYVDQLVAPLITFYNRNKTKLPQKVLEDWVTAVFSDISAQYFTCVRDVLQNAQKTEDSLRRLKKAKDKGMKANDSKGCSDDDKIRLQLVVDVHAYSAAVGILQVEKNQLPVLNNLSQLVERAKEKLEKQ